MCVCMFGLCRVRYKGIIPVSGFWSRNVHKHTEYVRPMFARVPAAGLSVGVAPTGVVGIFFSVSGA